MAKEKKTAKSAAKPAKAAKAAPKKAAAKVEPFKPLTKAQIVESLAVKSSVSKKDVEAVIRALPEVIGEELKKGADAAFQIPGLIKIEKQYVAAKEGQKNVPDPFHPGKTIDRPARPEHYKIKVRALKALKDMA